MIDLSVVVVNYNSARLVAGLIDTLFADTFEIDGRRAEVELILVDNASRLEDHELLESFRSERVRLLRNTENVGYALANNQGFHVARGRWHCVSNPDVLVRPGCLGNLIGALELRPGAAIAGPLATMDTSFEVLLPPNELPDPYNESLTSLARHHSGIARYAARRRARFAWRYWTAREPLALRMLSGGFFLGRRDEFVRHGLFDPGYPLYYEDTELFRRYHVLGRELLHVPAARIVHLFSRSALTRMKASLYRNHFGARRYFSQSFGDAGLRTMLAFQERARLRSVEHESQFPLIELAPSSEPPVIDVAAVEGAFVEVSGNAKFSLTVGIFPQRPGAFAFPRSFWESLAMTSYWCRTVDPKTGDTLSAWRVTKCPTFQ